jgi:hypothetical protein
MYTAIGGGTKDAVFFLKPRPKRPTRPTLKEKKKSDKMIKEEAKNLPLASNAETSKEPAPAHSNTKNYRKKRKRGEDSKLGSKRSEPNNGQTTEGVISAVGLTVKVKIPLKQSRKKKIISY